jgi:Kef-type K+ transport system membrane component KefB
MKALLMIVCRTEVVRWVASLSRRSKGKSCRLTWGAKTGSLGGAAWLAVGAALLSLVGVIIAGLIVGRRAKLSTVGSLNTGFTLLARGEFSIIIVNPAIAGGLMAVLQPFAALYVLILASASPLLAKESERIYDLSEKLFKRSQWRDEAAIEKNGVVDRN